MQKIPILLRSKDELSLIKQFLHLTKSVHGLTDTEINVVAVILRNAKNENGNLQSVLGYKGRVQLKEELMMSSNAFSVIISRLKSKKIINEYRFTPLLDVFNYDTEGCTISFKLTLDAKKS